MSSIGSHVVLLTCSDERGRLLVHGSRRDPGLSEVPTVVLPARPARADVDPVLAEHEPRRIVVAGTNADLAAVVLRLLRTERLTTEVAYLPTTRSSAVAAAWGLPIGRAAVALATAGTAVPMPLVRDDSGGVLLGRGEVRGLVGEAYCDEHLVLRGTAPRFVAVPGPHGLAVRSGRTGRRPDGRLRPVPPRAPSGRGSAVGRAVQLGGKPFTVEYDGVAHPREVRRWAWYRHTADWLLVRP
ncbi:hypothetical protein [Pseudonocardia nigra]|uniref:hypothetical protein n=1 Tax=Pseudonocardia nigra TaxID=1921578 RepID=UPI0027E2C0E6|nr:hypothetical protein [Pseudonocardia nigra]